MTPYISYPTKQSETSNRKHSYRDSGAPRRQSNTFSRSQKVGAMSVRPQVDSPAASVAAAVSADAIATLRVALRAVTALLPLDLATAAAGLRVADELRAVFLRSVDAAADRGWHGLLSGV